MAVIVSISPAIIDDRGGTILTLTGFFPVDTNINVYIGINRNSTDEPCYGGEAGYGYNCRSTDGVTLEVITPMLDLVGSQYVSAFHIYGSDDFAITVIEHMFSDTEFEIKKSWEPNYNSGTRSLRNEPVQ